MAELLVQPGAADDSPLAICIMGPTATGKTDLAMSICAELEGDIISVDSAMVYQELDIGSAKPSPEELARAPHRLINLVSAAQPYSVGRFREDALQQMHSITAGQRLPLLVGGTMMYFNALQKGIADLPEADASVRVRLEAEAGQSGLQAMHERLAKIDPEAAARIHPNDPQRLQRALEVYEITGKTLSAHWQQQAQDACPYRLLKIALMPPDRVALRRRIADRFDAMLVAGLVEEVRALYQRRDIHPDLPSMRSVGYRQVWQYLAGEYDYPTMRDKAIIATAQLAKRQMTWLRSEQNCNFIDPALLDVPKLLKNLKFLLS
jgi:tRNA dimethylallyltransferase